jgi:ATP-dependent RNA helicase RhlE
MEFKKLEIIEPILQALEKKGYSVATPIQEKTIPLLLEDKDVIGIAQTGTGKTAAFVLPIIQKLFEKKEDRKSDKRPFALILAPTRELVIQISESVSHYGSFLGLKQMALYGGVGMRPQIISLQRGTDIIVATPGRLLDLMNQGKVNLDMIEFFVLDEADRMLDMGFVRDITKIAAKLPKEKQSLFFSATMSREISILTKNFLRNPIRIEVTPESSTVEKIKQSVFFVDPENKVELLIDLIKENKMDCALVFTKTKHKADKISKVLNQNHISTDAIHGNKSQPHRERALRDFKVGKVKVLVATDIAARGIDVNNISHVINFELPNEPENYVHRIGRTARAGTEGTAYSFCSAEERNFLRDIERITKSKANEVEHKFHSDTAKDAVGNAAKPKPRGQRSSRFESRRPRGFGGSNNQSSRGRSFGGNRERSSFNKRPSFNDGSRDPRKRDSGNERGRFIRSNGSLGRDRRSNEDRRSGGSSYGNRNSGRGRDDRRSGGSSYGNRNSGRSGGSSYGGRGRDNRGSGRNAGSSRPNEGGHRRTSERRGSEGGRGNSRFDRRSSGSSKPRFNNSKNRR